MSDELLNILSASNKDMDNQKLMDYISNKLSVEDKHEFEKSMADSPMLNDMVEGLEKVKNKKHLDALVLQLNGQLKKQLDKKRIINNKRKIKDIPLLYLSIILIIIIILAGYLVIKKHLDTEKLPVRPPKKEAAFRRISNYKITVTL